MAAHIIAVAKAKEAILQALSDLHAQETNAKKLLLSDVAKVAGFKSSGGKPFRAAIQDLKKVGAIKTTKQSKDHTLEITSHGIEKLPLPQTQKATKNPTVSTAAEAKKEMKETAMTKAADKKVKRASYASDSGGGSNPKLKRKIQRKRTKRMGSESMQTTTSKDLVGTTVGKEEVSCSHDDEIAWEKDSSHRKQMKKDIVGKRHGEETDICLLQGTVSQKVGTRADTNKEKDGRRGGEEPKIFPTPTGLENKRQGEGSDDDEEDKMSIVELKRFLEANARSKKAGRRKRKRAELVKDSRSDNEEQEFAQQYARC